MYLYTYLRTVGYDEDMIEERWHARETKIANANVQYVYSALACNQ